MFLGLRLPVTDAILEIPDKVLKTAAMFFGQDLLPYLGVKGRITGIVPTEQVHLNFAGWKKILRYYGRLKIPGLYLR